jgi:hypothetical protein
MLPAFLSPAAALGSAGADQIALHVDQSTEHGQNQAAVRCRGYRPMCRQGI